MTGFHVLFSLHSGMGKILFHHLQITNANPTYPSQNQQGQALFSTPVQLQSSTNGPASAMASETQHSNFPVPNGELRI